MQQYSSKYFDRSPPHDTHDPRGWGQNSTFLKHGHVANQIKGNHECSNMVANILPAYPAPPDPTDLGE